MQKLKDSLDEVKGLTQCLLTLAVLALCLGVMVAGHARDFSERHSAFLLPVVAIDKTA